MRLQRLLISCSSNIDHRVHIQMAICPEYTSNGQPSGQLHRYWYGKVDSVHKIGQATGEITASETRGESTRNKKTQLLVRDGQMIPKQRGTCVPAKQPLRDRLSTATTALNVFQL